MISERAMHGNEPLLEHQLSVRSRSKSEGNAYSQYSTVLLNMLQALPYAPDRAALGGSLAERVICVE